MDASILRAFFLGDAQAQELAVATHGIWTRTSHDVTRLSWTNLPEDFTVTVDHLVRLADATASGVLSPEALSGIAFGLIADDHFTWDTDDPQGDRVGEALYDWASPEINYPLTPSNLAKFRHRLLTGESLFVRADSRASA